MYPDFSSPEALERIPTLSGQEIDNVCTEIHIKITAAYKRLAELSAPLTTITENPNSTRAELEIAREELSMRRLETDNLRGNLETTLQEFVVSTQEFSL